MLLKATADKECRVRAYQTDAQRDADASRAVGVVPEGEHGLIFELIFVTGNLTIQMSPIAWGANQEGTPTASIPLLVQNLSGGTDTIELDFEVIILET